MPQPLRHITSDMKEALDYSAESAKKSGSVQPYRREFGDAGFEYLAEQLQAKDALKTLTWIDLNDCYLTDASIPLLCEIIEQTPYLEKLFFNKSRFSAEGVKQLLNTLEGCDKLRLFSLTENKLGPTIGEAAAEFLRKSPQLRSLNLSGTQLGDKGMLPIIKAASEHTYLPALYLSHNRGTIASFDAMSALLERDAPWLRCGLVQNNSALDAKLCEKVQEKERPNLLAFFPMNDSVREYLDKNSAAASKAKEFLLQPSEKTSLLQKAFILRRYEAALSSIGNLIEQSRSKFFFEGHLETLPSLPERGAGYEESLFTLSPPDESGRSYAPLDNPRLWDSPEQAREVLTSTPLTKQFLARKTPQGASILESLSIALPPGEILSVLNGKGIRLGPKELLDEKGAPNELMQRWMDTGSIGQLFVVENWHGQSVRDLSKVHNALPETLRDEIEIGSLRARISTASRPGLGR